MGSADLDLSAWESDATVSASSQFLTLRRQVRLVLFAVMVAVLAACSSLDAKPEIRPGSPVSAPVNAGEGLDESAEARQTDGEPDDGEGADGEGADTEPADREGLDAGDGDAEGGAAADRDDKGDQPADADSLAEWGPLYDVLSVYDGDTIAVSIDGTRERVRIIGIDAPELARNGQPMGCFAQESTSEMQSLVQSQRVHLIADPTQADRDRYDRLLRHVVRDDGGHVALTMVQGGYAEEEQFAAPYQYQSDLVAAEQDARADGLGLWSACLADAAPVAPAQAPVAPAPVAPAPPPVAPAPVTPAPAPAPTECVIKGNIASDGEKIYHVPGQQYYDVTKISEHKGERWFCTEQQARDAGWRKAKV